MKHSAILISGAYQRMIANFAHMHTMIMEYNSAPTSELKVNVFKKHYARGLEILRDVQESYFFFSEKPMEKLRTAAQLMKNILEITKTYEPVEEELLRQFATEVKDLKAILMSEIFPEKFESVSQEGKESNLCGLLPK